MRKLIKQKKGQFVIIAMLVIAIMIISIGALIHRTVTYYKHEPWEEYLTLIGNIELSSRRLVEISLANHTNGDNPNILKENLEKWQRNLTQIYLGYGVSLNCPSNEIICSWNNPTSFSSASANFTLNINSIGLTGYKFAAVALLKLSNTTNPLYSNQNKTWSINVTVTDENRNLTTLKKDNFQILINELEHENFTVVPQYFVNYTATSHKFFYRIECQGVMSDPSGGSGVTLQVWDQRGIKVTAKYS